MENQENKNNGGLGTVLKLLRTARQMSIKDLSQKMNVSATYISEIESGKKNPSLEVLTKYSQALKVRRSIILYFDEEKNNNEYDNQRLLLEILKKIIDIEEKAIKKEENI